MEMSKHIKGKSTSKVSIKTDRVSFKLTQSKLVEEYDNKILKLYRKKQDLKFKILRPWLVLESGDVINN